MILSRPQSLFPKVRLTKADERARTVDPKLIASGSLAGRSATGPDTTATPAASTSKIRVIGHLGRRVLTKVSVERHALSACNR